MLFVLTFHIYVILLYYIKKTKTNNKELKHETFKKD